MRKLISIVHTSLDGFVAGNKGELDGFEAGEENLKFIGDLTEGADSALFGRISYQLLESYWPAAKDRANATAAEIVYSSWYYKAKKIVISATMQGAGLNNTIIIAKNIPAEVLKIKQLPGDNILIFGSPATSQLLIQHDLVDSYWIFINPVIFGEGVPFFKGIENNINLKLLTTKQFQNGELALNYIVSR